MARGAVVVILSDGWERGEPKLVAREMERLSRLAHRIIWVNPRVAASRVLAARGRDGGGAAVLSTRWSSGHSFVALQEVVRAIAAGAEAAGRRSQAAGVEPEPEDEAWASATPVPGSSVAMPSGYGPSRGKTTPGWVTDE